MNKGLCYVVSSYTRLTDHYSFVGIIIFNNKKYIVKGTVNNGPFIRMECLGAEVHGIIEVIKKCLELKIKEVDLYSYSQLLKDLMNGTKRTIKPGLIKFLDFIQAIEEKININCIKARKIDDIYEMKEAKFICRNMLGL